MSEPPAPQNHPPDTSATRRVQPMTILWLGILLGFMGIVAMAVATIMLAVAGQQVQSVSGEATLGQRSTSEPRLISARGAHDSPDGRFRLAIMIDANNAVRYSITTADASLARLADGSFDPQGQPWWFCWDEDSNLWVWATNGYQTIHRLRQTITFDPLTNWRNEPEFLEAAPQPITDFINTN